MLFLQTIDLSVVLQYRSHLKTSDINHCGKAEDTPECFLVSFGTFSST